MKKLEKPDSLKPKLVFFGNERLATGVSTDVPTLRALIEAGYQISALVASHNEGVSRNRRSLEIVDVAHAYHIPILIPDKLEEIASELQSMKAQAGVLVAFGKIIPRSIIDIFPKGIINIHPSLLPEYRGPTPVETAILDGKTKTGVSLMSLVSKMDAGPVYKQAELELDATETKPELANKLLKLGNKLLNENLAYILDGTLEALPQDNSAASYTKMIRKADGLTDFKQPAEQIERQVRAFLGFPKTRATNHGQEIILTKTRAVTDKSAGHLVIKCQPGYLEILELIAPSGRTISGADFLRGYQKN